MMRSAYILVVAALAAATTLTAASRVSSLEPGFGAPGDELVASGTDLAAGTLDKILLTVGSTDIELEIIDQAEGQVRFKIPADTAHGMYRLMLLTGGDVPQYLVQPIMCEVMAAADVEQRKSEEEDFEVVEETDATAPAEEAP